MGWARRPGWGGDERAQQNRTPRAHLCTCTLPLMYLYPTYGINHWSKGRRPTAGKLRKTASNPSATHAKIDRIGYRITPPKRVRGVSRSFYHTDRVFPCSARFFGVGRERCTACCGRLCLFSSETCSCSIARRLGVVADCLRGKQKQLHR